MILIPSVTRGLMDTLSNLYFFLCIVTGFTFCENITLHGPAYAMYGTKFWINCSAESIPYRSTAELVLNDDTYDTLHKYDSECFSANSGKICNPDKCRCSEDGTSFAFKIDPSSLETELNISCFMKFKQFFLFYESSQLTVEIISK